MDGIFFGGGGKSITFTSKQDVFGRLFSMPGGLETAFLCHDFLERLLMRQENSGVTAWLWIAIWYLPARPRVVCSYEFAFKHRSNGVGLWFLFLRVEDTLGGSHA